jgi:hypothetical protein
MLLPKPLSYELRACLQAAADQLDSDVETRDAAVRRAGEL